MAYALMVFGAFAVVSVVARNHDDDHSLASYRGLAARQPMLAGLLTLFLLAQAGVPLTGGFVAKLSVFDAAVDAGQYSLALIGMLTAVIGAFVYLRIVLTMYAPEPLAEGAEDTEADAPGAGGTKTARRVRVDSGTRVALAIAAAGVLFLGILPNVVLEFARDATQLLR